MQEACTGNEATPLVKWNSCGRQVTIHARNSYLVLGLLPFSHSALCLGVYGTIHRRKTPCCWPRSQTGLGMRPGGRRHIGNACRVLCCALWICIHCLDTLQVHGHSLQNSGSSCMYYRGAWAPARVYWLSCFQLPLVSRGPHFKVATWSILISTNGTVHVQHCGASVSECTCMWNSSIYKTVIRMWLHEHSTTSHRPQKYNNITPKVYTYAQHRNYESG